MSGFLATGKAIASCPNDVVKLTTIINSFMKNVYSVFSFDKHAVGFAQLT